MEEKSAQEIAENLPKRKWTHKFPKRVEEAIKLEMRTNIDVPEEVYDLMELFPQSPQQRPSVHYVSLPRRKKEEQANSRSRKHLP